MTSRRGNSRWPNCRFQRNMLLLPARAKGADTCNLAQAERERHMQDERFRRREEREAARQQNNSAASKAAAEPPLPSTRVPLPDGLQQLPRPVQVMAWAGEQCVLPCSRVLKARTLTNVDLGYAARPSIRAVAHHPWLTWRGGKPAFECPATSEH